MKPPLSVSRPVSNDFFSKTSYRIFMKFGMKLWCLKSKKMTEPDFFFFFGKNNISGKKSKNIPKIGWFGVSKMFNPLMCTVFCFTRSIIIAFMILQKRYVLEISDYMHKCLWPIRLHGFLNFNISKIL